MLSVSVREISISLREKKEGLMECDGMSPSLPPSPPPCIPPSHSSALHPLLSLSPSLPPFPGSGGCHGLLHRREPHALPPGRERERVCPIAPPPHSPPPPQPPSLSSLHPGLHHDPEEAAGSCPDRRPGALDDQRLCALCGREVRHAGRRTCAHLLSHTAHVHPLKCTGHEAVAVQAAVPTGSLRLQVRA